MLILMNLLMNELIFMNEVKNEMSFDSIKYEKLNGEIVLMKIDALKFFVAIRITAAAFLLSIKSVGCLDVLLYVSSTLITLFFCLFLYSIWLLNSSPYANYPISNSFLTQQSCQA